MSTMNKKRGFLLLECIAYISLVLVLFLFFYSLSNNFIEHYKKVSTAMNLQESGEVIEKFFKAEMKMQGNVVGLYVKNKGLISYDEYNDEDILAFFYTNTYLKERADIYETFTFAFKVIESSEKLILCKNVPRVTSNIGSLVGYEIANHINNIKIEKIDNENFFVIISLTNNDIIYVHKFHIKNKIIET